MVPYYAPTYFGRVIFHHGSGCIVKWSEIRKKIFLADCLSGIKRKFMFFRNRSGASQLTKTVISEITKRRPRLSVVLRLPVRRSEELSLDLKTPSIRWIRRIYGSVSLVGSKEHMMVGATPIVYACMPYAPMGPNWPLAGPYPWALGPEAPSWAPCRALS